MISNRIVLIAFSFIILLTSTCWASEKPIGDITDTQQVIDKLFTGRTLDPIEGIWFNNPGITIAIAKASLVTIKDPDYKNCDYVGIILKGKYAGRIYITFIKTEYSYAFVSRYDWEYNEGLRDWKLLSPTLLQFDGGKMTIPTRSFIRTYPNP